MIDNIFRVIICFIATLIVFGPLLIADSFFSISEKQITNIQLLTEDYPELIPLVKESIDNDGIITNKEYRKIIKLKEQLHLNKLYSSLQD